MLSYEEVPSSQVLQKMSSKDSRARPKISQLVFAALSRILRELNDRHLCLRTYNYLFGSPALLSMISSVFPFGI